MFFFRALGVRSIYSDDLVRPFPSEYLLSDGTKDFGRLLECIRNRDIKLNNFLKSSFPEIQEISRNPIISKLLSTKKHARPDKVFQIEWDSF